MVHSFQKLLSALERLDLSFNYIEEIQHLVVGDHVYLDYIPDRVLTQREGCGVCVWGGGGGGGGGGGEGHQLKQT